MSSNEPEPLREPAGPSGPSTTTTTVLERELVEERQLSEPGDHERFAHYVQKDKIVESSVMGTPLVALCGKVWVPSRDPKRYPVCPTCKEIYEGLPPGGDEGE